MANNIRAPTLLRSPLRPCPSFPGTDTPSNTVILTLSARTPASGNVLFPKRTLTLTRSNNTITVGRASKVSTKGFIAAPDNAWFDSPVMSRQHAQFTADVDGKVRTTHISPRLPFPIC